MGKLNYWTYGRNFKSTPRLSSRYRETRRPIYASCSLKPHRLNKSDKEKANPTAHGTIFLEQTYAGTMKPATAYTFIKNIKEQETKLEIEIYEGNLEWGTCGVPEGAVRVGDGVRLRKKDDDWSGQFTTDITLFQGEGVETLDPRTMLYDYFAMVYAENDE